MPRLPKLPRRRPKWQRLGIKTLRGAGEIAAWFGIGFAAVSATDTASEGSWLYTAIFITIVAAGTFVMKYGRRLIRTVRYSRTPKRHRRDPSSDSQTHNLSIRRLTSALTRRFRRD